MRKARLYESTGGLVSPKITQNCRDTGPLNSIYYGTMEPDGFYYRSEEIDYVKSTVSRDFPA